MYIEPAIDVQNITKYFEIYSKPSHRLLQMLFRGKKQFFQPYWALKDISFQVGKGECVGIIGRNGAGKSTLLQIITGTLSPSSGKVKNIGRVAALLELGSGFNPEFTGRDNVFLNAAILGLSHKEIVDSYDSIVEFADIGKFIDQPVKSYSSGMVVRLAFSVIAHVKADILIIDEALAVGDAYFTQKCMRFLRKFMETKTVLFVSHDIAAVNSLCSRAIFLEDGYVKVSGEPKEVTDIYLQDFYESVQGKSEISGGASSLKKEIVLPGDVEFQDMRAEYFLREPLRNDIRIFQFDESRASFGKGGCLIKQVFLTDANESPLNWIVGGEMVGLSVYCHATEELLSPIVGFHFKDRLGQILFGDNTFLSYLEQPLHISSGEWIVAKFSFRMPILAPGDYSVGVAVADGTQHEHVQHHWLHDALLLTSVTESVCTGIIGIPMKKISMSKIADFESFQKNESFC